MSRLLHLRGFSLLGTLMGDHHTSGHPATGEHQHTHQDECLHLPVTPHRAPDALCRTPDLDPETLNAVHNPLLSPRSKYR
jgi:hypothetical protein